eukprot:TRINITY_DN879_c0_g1_i1.p2 TRINITY_DN879_c0_g1~~TRINITY_DN879_c0_g1_i1.p2  ORF type:complete len:120 (-),score=29.63 TRINITY_DN879_c0_g1_i1:258-617(-)
MSKWSTGLFDIQGEPGGIGLCCKSCWCPCLVMGEINERIGGPGGFAGPALGIPLCMLCGIDIHPIWQCVMALDVAKKAGFEEGIVNACCMTCWCGPCYLSQIHKETTIKNIKPGQMEMK